MKKQLILCAFVIMTHAANAQVTFGINGGFNFSKASTSFAEEEEPKTKFKIGPRLGFIANYPVDDKLSIRSGLIYSSKGYKINESQSETFMGTTYTSSSKATLKISYLEIPITAVYKIDNIEIIAGPYFAFGVGGEYSFEWSFSGGTGSSSGSETADLKFANEVSETQEDDENFYQRGLDAGINIGVGYNIGPGVVGLNFIKGLTNTTPSFASEPDFDPSDYKFKNTVISLNFTYFIEF